MNKVILIGNVGSEIEKKIFDNGTQLGNFSLATNQYWKDKNGERQTATTWHNLKAFGKTVDFIENWVSKGDKIAIEGSIKTETWKDAESRQQYKTVIEVDKVELIMSKEK